MAGHNRVQALLVRITACSHSPAISAPPDRASFGLRLASRRGQRHHIGNGYAAAEEDAIVLHVIIIAMTSSTAAMAVMPSNAARARLNFECFMCSLSTRNARVESSTSGRCALPQCSALET